MSLELYHGHPEFVSACRFWKQHGQPPVNFADWFGDRGLLAEAAGWRFLAEGYTGDGSGVKIRKQNGHWLWTFWGAGGTAADLPGAVAGFLGWWAALGLSDEQLTAAREVILWSRKKEVATLGGYAGTGKTRVLSHLHRALPRWATVAYTGKAAHILRSKGLPGNTIHGTIYRGVYENGRRVRWELLSPFELWSVEGFLIDEASMVGRDVLRDLLSYKKPIIAVGDHGQLPPVGDDAGLMREPDVTLEHVHRNAGPIAKFAEHLRTGGHPGRWRYEGDDPAARTRVAVVRTPPEKSLLAADQIICAFNKTRVAINRKVRRLLAQAGLLAAADDDVPVHDDRVMCLRNNAEELLFNGQQGRVVDGVGDGWFRFLPDGNTDPQPVAYLPESFNQERREADLPPDRQGRMPFDFCYAITCHKAQGDEWDKVIVFDQECGAWDMARWRYTAASRARQALIWVV